MSENRESREYQRYSSALAPIHMYIPEFLLRFIDIEQLVALSIPLDINRLGSPAC